MSEKINEDNAPVEELNEDAEKEVAPAEHEEKPLKTKKKSGKKKWIFIIILGMLLGVSGLGIKYAPEQFSFLLKKYYKAPEVSVDEDNLTEEMLSPFFIPPGAEENTIRIDLSIVWDGLASIRFKKKELNLRNMMYEKFYDIAKQNQDLNENIPYMENEVSSMLRQSLGVQNLVVRIKEIRYF